MLETVFSLASTAALLSWVALILGPRWTALLATLRIGVAGGLSALYAVLVSVWFFRVDGGGYGALAQVQVLFTSAEVALAGWVHYLAFDLFVGLWIAARSDEIGLSRLIQAPILLATFLFGPVGYLLFVAARTAAGRTGAPEQPA